MFLMSAISKEQDELAIKRYGYQYLLLCRGRRKVIDTLIAVKKMEKEKR